MLGLANPFETFKKHQKTLIATPSKFEIRTVEEPKRGRGRPRKDTSDDQDPGAKTGIRDKLANAKLGIDDTPTKKGARPSKNPELMEKRSRLSGIPPWRDGSIWHSSSKAKADLFAITFYSKAELPEDFSDWLFFLFLRMSN